MSFGVCFDACCDIGPCPPCAGGGAVPLLQLTLGGFTQVNTPANVTTPCGTNACTDMNKTVALTYTSDVAYTATDATLNTAYAADRATGVPACSYYYSETLCDNIFNSVVTFELFVTLYRRAAGGVGVYMAIHYVESDTADGYNLCSRISEAYGSVTTTGSTIDCESISKSLDLTTVTAACFAGGPGPAWCDGSPITALLETAP